MGKPSFAKEDLSRWKREINPAPIVAKRIKIQRVNDEWLGCCPDVFHKVALGKSDTHPSFTIYKLDDGTWGYKCFSCSANGNVFQFVQHIDKIPFPKAVARVLEEAGVEGWQDGTEQSEVSVPTDAEVPKEHVTFPLTQYHPAIEALEHAPEGQAWLRKRGISMETARKFKIGFVQSAAKIVPVHPWRDDGWILFPTLSADGQTVTSVKYRSVTGKKKKQSDGKTVSGILRAQDTSTTLFNIQNVKPGDDVWLCEGEPDTVVLAQAGLIAVGLPMATYKPTDEEFEVLNAASRRFLAGDNDSEGKKAMDKLAEKLSGETHRIQWPNNRKDANDVLTHECGNDLKKFKTLVQDLTARAIQTETEAILIRGDQIIPERIRWMWFEKIPFGKLTLFAGNPDNGKSLASTDVAARVTTGTPFPEEQGQERSAPAEVLMMVGEDDLKDTAVPRLIAAGADMKRVHFLLAARPVQKEDREVKLDMDIPAIEKKLEQHPNIRLIVIDPVSNYLGDVNMMAEQEVRTILIPLKRMAEKFNIAIVQVMHLNKKNDLDAISRVGGAMAFIGVSRCSWLFARDPKEEPAEGEEAPKELVEKKPDTFSMLRIKNNLVSSSKSGMAYMIKVRPIPIPNAADIITPYVEWGGVVDRSADEALGQRTRTSEPVMTGKRGRPSEALQKAVKWLADALQDNQPRPSTILIKDAKAAEGISADTLRNAKDELHVRHFKTGTGTAAKWMWVLDQVEATAESVAPQSDDDMFDVEGSK